MGVVVNMGMWIKVGSVGLPVKSESLTLTRHIGVEDTAEAIVGKIVKKGKLAVDGDVTTPLLTADGVDVLLYAFMGKVDTSGTGPYTHEFTVKDRGLPELTIVKEVGSVQEKYNGVKVSKVSIKANGKGEFEATFTLMGKDGAVVTGESPGTYDDSDPVTLDGAAVTWGGVEYGVANLTFTAERSMDGEGFLINGDAGRSVIGEGRMKITGSMEIVAEDETLASDYLAGTEKALTITLGGLTIEVPRAVITKRERVITLENGNVIEKVEFAGLYDAATGGLKLTLTNNVAAYPRD